MNMTVLGAGRWGTFIAWYLNKIGNKVILWGREGSKKLEELQQYRKNKFLEIPEEILLTSSLDKAISESECIVIAIEAQNLADFMQTMKKYNFENTVTTPLSVAGNGEGVRIQGEIHLPKEIKSGSYTFDFFKTDFSDAIFVRTTVNYPYTAETTSISTENWQTIPS